MVDIHNSLAYVMHLPGVIGACIVDISTGQTLARVGDGTLNIEIAAAGNTDVVRAKIRTMDELNLQDEIQDILITLGTQYHIIRPLTGKGSAGLFMYVALDKEKSNLALSRHKVNEICKELRP
jgi:hypothetical protein